MEQQDEKELMVINVDTVRELRRRGFGSDAMKMISAHQNQLKKSFDYIRKSDNLYRAKINKIKNISKGLCNCGRELDNNLKFIHCEICRKRRREYNKKYSDKK